MSVLRKNINDGFEKQGRSIALVVEFLQDDESMTLLRSALYITCLQRAPFPEIHSSDPHDASSPVHHPHLRPQSSSHPQSTMPELDMPL
ncbi:hypothetical protein K503DRAFT_773758 [Rhizopogon vinicolor AM-OR11-026]|uniref:Uncharacterized protein n=1 Tax=Rhizopogon vinicolor AM-OR11-026 TaxID=1314800 RepID=A0A1B7MRC8_9AGAM|nr:hypothetical protein K503DRAFT_773758 [Rhizopogon vinicolor AM-OR11-026]